MLGEQGNIRMRERRDCNSCGQECSVLCRVPDRRWKFCCMNYVRKKRGYYNPFTLPLLRLGPSELSQDVKGPPLPSLNNHGNLYEDSSSLYSNFPADDFEGVGGGSGSGSGSGTRERRHNLPTWMWAPPSIYPNSSSQENGSNLGTQGQDELFELRNYPQESRDYFKGLYLK